MDFTFVADTESRAAKVPAVKGQPLGYTVLESFTQASVPVTENSALAVAAFYNGIRIISETVGTLPLNVYKRTSDDGRKLALNHPAFDLLHDAPNPESTASVVRAGLQAQSMLHGNAFAEIEWNDPQARDFPIAIWPIPHEAVTAWRDENSNLYYRVQTLGGPHVDLEPEDILHYRGLAFDGFWGKSILQVARESLGLSITYDRHAGKFFGNGSKPGVVLKHPGRLGSEAVTRLREGWERVHKGIENTGRVAILEEGMDLTSFTVNNDDAQFLESRKFSVEEVARWLNISLGRLRVAGATAFTSPEDDAIDFMVNTVRPWLVKIEQENNKKLFPGGKYFCEHQTEGQLRGNIATRYQSYAVARNWGWFSVNDIRKLENLPPIENGDQYMSPLNMAALGQTPAPAMAPTSAPSLGTVEGEPLAAPVQHPAPKPEPTPEPAPESVDIASTALNGAQVASLLEIVLQVAQGALTKDSAKALASAAFPTLDAGILDRIFDPVEIKPLPVPEPVQ